MSTTSDTEPLRDRADREISALTEYMTVLEDVGRARDADGLYVVVAESGREYLVDVRQGACECDDAFYRDVTCKHQYRAAYATGRREIPAWVDRSRVDPQLGLHVDDVQEADSA